MSQSWFPVIAFWPLIALCTLSTAPAAIMYGDFSDIPPGAVMYLDVTESANSPGDPEPLFGPPTIAANTLHFNPTASFAAFSSGGTQDRTEGQLRFGLGGEQAAITHLQLTSIGNYHLSGAGVATAEYRSGIAQLHVLEVDGAPVPSPIVLPGLDVAGLFEVANGKVGENSWTSTATYDINAALTAAAVKYHAGATKLGVVMNHLMEAQADAASIASIDTRGFEIGATTVPVPEPSGFGLLVGSLLALLRRQ
ncbi:MAG: hypothetical protein AAGF97_14095 [Planctomycetota bacterium]